MVQGAAVMTQGFEECRVLCGAALPGETRRPARASLRKPTAQARVASEAVQDLHRAVGLRGI